MSMNKRISLILQAKNISPAQLADNIGVQRSGISHIMNGRNKPSLDFIQRILKKYPDINMNWLIFGDGQMMNPFPTQNISEEKKIAEVRNSRSAIMELFTEPNTLTKKEVEENIDINNDVMDANESTDMKLLSSQNPNNRDDFEKHKSNESKRNEVHYNSINKEIKVDGNKKISRIVIFYNDLTFTVYTPEND